MVFSSLTFIYLFLPAFLLVYYLTKESFRSYVLFFGSLIFYAVGCADHPVFLLLLLALILTDYVSALLMERFPYMNKVFLWIAGFFHLLALIYFKYSGFLFTQVLKLIHDRDYLPVILPLGISFYTFTGISYLCDVLNGKTEAERELVDFAAFMTMFPKLTAGPLVPYGQVRKDLKNLKVNYREFLKGLELFILGLGFKVILANRIGGLWTQAKSIGFDSISTPFAWLAIFAFSFQLYFDFHGYSMMAVGLGRMLGFHLPKNFDHPYICVTMTDFWRRWHITLGAWFRDYVYIPLGGNRKGKGRTILNIFIVWMLTGIWHGAGYNFILWGLALFLIMVLEKRVLYLPLHHIPVVGHLYMIILIPLSWALFAITEGPSEILLFFSRLFPFVNGNFSCPLPDDWVTGLGQYGKFFILSILFSTPLMEFLWELLKTKFRLLPWLFLIGILAFSTWCMRMGMNDPFMYFSF